MNYSAVELSKKKFSSYDKYKLSSFIFSRGLTGVVYDENSKRFEVKNSVVILKDRDGNYFNESVDNLEIIVPKKFNKDTAQVPYQVRSKTTNEVHPPMEYLFVSDPDSDISDPVYDKIKEAFSELVNESDDVTKRVSINDYTPYPQGSLWEQYLSEIVIVPFLKDGRFDWDNEHIKNYFDTSGDEASTSYYENCYLVWHPETLTGCQMTVEEGGKTSFFTSNLNNPYSSDSIVVALTSPFNWAITECDYGQ